MFALFNTVRLSLLLWYMTFIVYVVFVGLRFEVGPDWVQYGRIHNSLSYAYFWDVIGQTEPLSYLLFWVSETSGYHTLLTNLVAALITLGGVFCFARRTSNPWLALLAATPYFIIVMGMSGIRQAMAAGVVLFLLSRWERYSFIKRALFILVSAMFHTSALVNNIFLVARLDIAMRYKIMLGALVGLATFYIATSLSAYSDNIVNYQRRYIEGAGTYQSYGSLYHIAMIAVPAVLGMIYRKRIFHAIHNIALLRFGLYASVVVFIVNIFSSTAASRLTIYMYFIPMMVYPAFTTTLARRSRLGTICAVIAFHFCILISWFWFGNLGGAYIPYQNILFDE